MDNRGSIASSSCIWLKWCFGSLYLHSNIAINVYMTGEYDSRLGIHQVQYSECMAWSNRGQKSIILTSTEVIIWTKYFQNRSLFEISSIQIHFLVRNPYDWCIADTIFPIIYLLSTIYYFMIASPVSNLQPCRWEIAICRKITKHTIR